MKKAKIKWNWNDDRQDDISRYLEQGNKNNNSWWKGLSTGCPFSTMKSFLSSKSKLFLEGQDIDQFPPRVHNMKFCRGINNILDYSLIIKSPCEIFIALDSNGGVYAEPANEFYIKMSFHRREQFFSEENNIFQDYLNIKFCFPITYNSSKVPALFLEPQFHKHHEQIKIINGCLTGKDTLKTQLNIQTLLKIPKDKLEFTIKKGDVLAYLWFPQKPFLERDSSLQFLPHDYLNPHL